MDVTGARWGLESAEAVLQLRALRSSGDFSAYWKFHERQEHERNHKTKYLAQTIPKTIRRLQKAPLKSRPTLVLVPP